MNKRPVINSDFSKNEGNKRSRDLLSNPTEIQKKEIPQDVILEKSQIQESKEDPTFLKERMTIQMNKETIERAKNAVYWTPGMTITQLTEEAYKLLLNKMEKERGKPFPQRTSELKPGRPLK